MKWALKDISNGNGRQLYSYLWFYRLHRQAGFRHEHAADGSTAYPGAKGPRWKSVSLAVLDGVLWGLGFDLLAKVLRRNLPVSSIRVKKFCANTIFEAAVIRTTGFVAPVSLREGLERTIRYEFGDGGGERDGGTVFYTE